jgi:hypothetical protein
MGAVLFIALLAALPAAAQAVDQGATFHRDVVPILERRCQECHRAGQMAPMALTTYEETRPWARAIRQAVVTRQMPPWFADSCCGAFSNARSLSREEIDTLARWAEGGAPGPTSGSREA